MIDGQNFFDQPIKNDIYYMLKTTCDNIWKIVTGHGDNFYSCFKEHYKLIVIDLCKQQALDGDFKKYRKLILLEIQMDVFH